MAGTVQRGGAQGLRAPQAGSGQSTAPQEKFDRAKHAGTVYDPVSGRRVPVSYENQLPKPKSNAEQILELQKAKLHQEDLMKHSKPTYFQ